MKWRIMIVDDESDVRMVLRTTLSEKFEVVEAVDGLDALEKLQRCEPDFICMDVMMPLMDGFEACATIRKDPRYADVPILFLSAVSQKEEIKKGYGAGANLYLTKPFEPARLMRNIEMYFEGAEPSGRRKRYSIKELERMEKEGDVPPAPAAPPPKPAKAAKAAAAPRQAPEAPVPAPAAPVRPRILIVDDEEDVLRLFRGALDKKAEIVTAGDGIAAIEKLVRYQPDIMVIDIMLPKMSGFQLCQSVRANRAFRTLPILVCSAKSADRDRQFAKRVGADLFLGKPFDAATLVARIEELQQLPTFSLRQKNMTIEEIDKIENPPKAEKEEDIFVEERDASTRTTRALERLLAEEKARESGEESDVRPTQVDSRESTGDTRKSRSLLRFGKK